MSQLKATLKCRSFKKTVKRRCESVARRRSPSKKLRLGMKSASAKSLVNGRSKVRAACHVCLSTTPICGTQSKRAVEENQSSVTNERSRCWGKAAAPNEVIFLSSSSSSPSSIVKFDVTQIYQQKKLSRQTFERRRVAAVGC
jgi:hypothetical protein